MSELYEKSLRKLELDQVLQLLAECAGSEGGKEACLSLQPSSDLEEVELMLNQTTAASDLCTRKQPRLRGRDRLFRVSGAGRPGRQLAERGAAAYCRHSPLCPEYQGLRRRGRQGDGAGRPVSGAQPNKYLEDKIFGAILSEEEIADNASPGAVRHPPPYAHSGREDPGQPAKSHFLPSLFQIPAGADHHHPSGAVRGSCEKRVQNDVPGLVHDVSATGSTYFVEPMSAVNANNAAGAGIKGKEGNRADSGGAVCRSGGASGGHFRELPAVNPAGCDLCQIQAVLPNASRSAYYE